MGFHAELRIALLFALVAFVLWLVSRKLRTGSELLKLHLEGRNRLLDRFGDAQSFLDFVRTDEGRHLLEPPQTARGPRPRPGLRLFQGALVCLPLGYGLRRMGLSWIAQANAARGSYLDHFAISDGRQYQLLGTLLLCVGVGLLLAALAAWLADRGTR